MFWENEIISKSNDKLDKWMTKNRKKEEYKVYEDNFIYYLDIIGRKKYDKDTKQELKLVLYDAYKNGVVDINSRTKQQISTQ